MSISRFMASGILLIWTTLSFAAAPAALRPDRIQSVAGADDLYAGSRRMQSRTTGESKPPAYERNQRMSGLSSPGPREHTLAPVGPEIIWDQTEQDCAGTIFVDTYASSMGFLKNVEPPGMLGEPYCNSDGSELYCWMGTCQDLYWLDQIPADGSPINGIDLKYHTNTTGGIMDNYINVHFRHGTSLSGVGQKITEPGTYVMGPMPVNIHSPPDPEERTAYFIRMSTPGAADIAAGAIPGYLVAELVDEGLPVDLSWSNLVPGSEVETQMPDWLPTDTVGGAAFGVAMSLNQGWDGDQDSSDDETMGWYLAGHDLQVTDPRVKYMTWLDAYGEQLIGCTTGGGLGWFTNCGPSCAPDEPYPTAELSIYMVLWAKFLDCNGNEVPDADDIALGTSADEDNSGVPDECEVDCDGDGVPDLFETPEYLFQNTSPAINPPPPDAGPLSQDIHLPDSAWLTRLRITYRSLGDGGGFMIVRLFEGSPYNDVSPVNPEGLIAEYELGPLEVQNGVNLVKALEVTPPLELPSDMWMEVEFLTDAGSFGVVRKSGPPSIGESDGLIYNRETQQIVSEDEHRHLRLWGVLCYSDCNDNGVRDREDILGGTSRDVNANMIPDECECICGDIDCSGGGADLSDFATFAACYGHTAPNPPDCDEQALACSDLDGNGIIDLGDFATFAAWYGLQTTQTVPNCVQE